MSIKGEKGDAVEHFIYVTVKMYSTRINKVTNSLRPVDN